MDGDLHDGKNLAKLDRKATIFRFQYENVALAELIFFWASGNFGLGGGQELSSNNARQIFPAGRKGFGDAVSFHVPRFGDSFSSQVNGATA